MKYVKTIILSFISIVMNLAIGLSLPEGNMMVCTATALNQTSIDHLKPTSSIYIGCLSRAFLFGLILTFILVIAIFTSIMIVFVTATTCITVKEWFFQKDLKNNNKTEKQRLLKADV